jgi:hypothetical protein
MTREFYNFKPKKNLYDGAEDGFYKFNMEVIIPKIGKHIIFNNIMARPIWEFDSVFKNKFPMKLAVLKQLFMKMIICLHINI